LPDTDLLERIPEAADPGCNHSSSGQDLMMEAYLEESDWAFIVKVDAILEAVWREIGAGSEGARRRRRSPPRSAHASRETEECPIEISHFVDRVRRLRSEFAHDLCSIDKSIADVIDDRDDRPEFLRAFWPTGDACRISAPSSRTHRTDSELLRLGILQRTLMLLGFANADERRAPVKRASSA
jgi:hypothetical protein